ncbi:MAG: neutral/alkaline non-lysosomal ceramidase N-terminal domain-containing protein [Candidatus Rokubacteria bacterium]|nr:neutral/alkaline non-lysosomal ceramidase N-terminal domain-containing protein [Candidatus Rokubacteria bacterium]
MSRRATLLAAAVCVLFAVGSVEGAGIRAACTDCLLAGAATVALRVPMGTPLGGYGALRRRLLLPDVFGRHPHAFWFKPATTERDPLKARALVLEVPPRRLAWVTVDLVAVDRAFTREVERRIARAGLGATTVIVSASHTHSGPGAFVDSAVMGWLAMDRFDPAVRDALADAVVEAVRRAASARAPALAGGASVAANGLTRSRLGQALDPEVVVLKVVRPSGEPVALLWNYAIHGTVLGPGNLRLSGDVMGVASAEIERELGVPVLFVNGAVGDVSPAGHGERAVADLGGALGAAVRAGWQRAHPAAGVAVEVASRSVALPSARLSLRNCASRWLPRFLRVPLGDLFSRDAELVAVAAGDTALVTIPGELQTALGLAIKQAARPLFAHVVVAGVSNDYLGYFVTPEDYGRPAYVTCATVYGPQAGTCLAETAIDLLHQLHGSPRPVTRRPRAACDFSPGVQR